MTDTASRLFIAAAAIVMALALWVIAIESTKATLAIQDIAYTLDREQRQ